MRHNVVRLTLLGGCLYAARRYYRNWGASKEDCKMSLPGDELVKDPALQTTEVVSIDAPVDEVWPWLVQIGQDRGGLCGFATLEKRLDVGDAVRLAPEGWMGLRVGVTLRVVDLASGERIVLRAVPPELPWDVVWSFHLVPHWEGGCRLIARRRIGLRRKGDVLAAELAGPFTALLTRGILMGIKRRAEAGAESSQNDAAQISPILE